jgi:hypothetical protein
VKEVLPGLAPLLEANGDIISAKTATLKENLKTNNKWGLAQGPIKVNFAETLTPFGNFECQNEKGGNPWLFTLRANLSIEGGGAYPIPGIGSLFVTLDQPTQVHIVCGKTLLGKAS